MAPRRTKRRVQPKDSDLSSDHGDYKPAPQAKRVRGKRGGLARLPTMPLDVILEILWYLDPKDLIHLARTSKDFRRVLLRRDASRRIWKAACEGIYDLPPCPNDMSEPAYINLMFYSFCHHCGKGPCDKIYWDCRARYCNSCQRALSSRRYGTVYDIRTILHVAVPFPWNHLPVYMIVPVLHEHLVDADLPAYSKHPGIRESDLVAIEEKIVEMDEDEVAAYINAKTEEMLVAREQTRALIRWKEDDERYRIDNSERLKNQRLEGIKKKLVELGYKNEVAAMFEPNWFRNPLVSQAKPLTDRIWKNIEPKMVEAMEDVRHDRLKSAMKSTIEERLVVLEQVLLAIQPRRQYDMSLRDIALGIPKIREVIVQLAVNKVTIADFNFLKTALPAFAKKWKADAATYLGDLVKEKIKLSDAVDPLSLAVGGIFSCTLCGGSCNWPSILSHTCAERAAYPHSYREYYTEVVVAFLPVTTWSPTHFEVQMDLLPELVKLYGLNPKEATIAQMDASPLRIQYADDKLKYAIRVMTWRDTYEYFQDGQQAAHTLKVVSVKHSEIAEPLEAEAKQKRKGQRANYRIWRCVYCPTLPKATHDTQANILGHLRTTHNFENPTEEDVVLGDKEMQCRYMSTYITLIDESAKGKWQYEPNRLDASAYASSIRSQWTPEQLSLAYCNLQIGISDDISFEISS